MAIRTFVILALGAVVSVLVALGCALLQDGTVAWTSQYDERGRPVLRSWLWAPPAEWPKTPNQYAWNTTFGYEAELVSWNSQGTAPSTVGGPLPRTQTRHSAGFPMAALETRHEGLTGAVAKLQAGRFAFYGWERGGTYTPVSPTAVSDVIVPLMPYWPGLLMDAAIYGFIGGAIVIWLGGRRRRRRWRRGECVECGYALGNLDRCPECGSAVSAPGPGPPP